MTSDTESAKGSDRDITIDEYFKTVRLDIRVHNALLRGGVKTMAKMCKMSDDELMRIRNFGPKCLEVVVEERQKYLAAGHKNLRFPEDTG